MNIDREQFSLQNIEQGSAVEFPHRDEMKDIYQQAFAGYPWFEKLSDEEVY